jgi:hypothetical protein
VTPKEKTMNETPRSSRSVLFLAVPALILLLPFAYSLVAYVAGADTAAARPFLEKPDPKYRNCVRETTYMRFHHWELLKTVREEVVRQGKPSETGLKQCKNCHTSRERFCNQCHNAVTLNPDCFGCHYYP